MSRTNCLLIWSRVLFQPQLGSSAQSPHYRNKCCLFCLNFVLFFYIWWFWKVSVIFLITLTSECAHHNIAHGFAQQETVVLRTCTWLYSAPKCSRDLTVVLRASCTWLCSVLRTVRQQRQRKCVFFCYESFRKIWGTLCLDNVIVSIFSNCQSQ